LTTSKPARRALTLALPIMCASMAGMSTNAVAQQELRKAGVRNLPRPGLEAPPIRVGSATLQLQLDAGALYDTNVYATSVNAEDDISFRLKPTAELALSRPTMDLSANLWGDVLEHTQITNESNAQYGGRLDLAVRPGDAHKLTGGAHFNHLTQSRADPEARAPTFVSPRRFNDYGGQLGYAYQGANLGVAVSGNYRRVSFRDATESDQDHRALQGTGRVSWLPHGGTALFVEGFYVHRDFDLATDFNGIDRNATTYGVNVGVSRDLTGVITGSVGAGFFRFDPSDPTLEGYSGFGFNGLITWTPQARTSVTASLFRGDVATVRSGATGRIDTRLSLHVDQEVRHNFLVGATLSWVRNEYRGSSDQKRNTLGAALSAEYLLGPRLSLFSEATFARRTADQPTDEFDRAQIQAGLRLRF